MTLKNQKINKQSNLLFVIAKSGSYVCCFFGLDDPQKPKNKRGSKIKPDTPILILMYK
jgi:cyclic lactone autoinducer peptide